MANSTTTATIPTRLFLTGPPGAAGGADFWLRGGCGWCSDLPRSALEEAVNCGLASGRNVPRLLYTRARVSLRNHESLARCSAAGARWWWREHRDRDPQGLAGQVRDRQGNRVAQRRPRALQRGPLPRQLRLPAPDLLPGR